MTIFQQIEHVRQQTSGWCSQLKAETLASLVMATRPKVTVEIGCWFGKSLFGMAIVHKHLGLGTVYAVDPWLNHCSTAGQTDPKNIEWWGRQDAHEQAYQSFLKTTDALGLNNVVSVQRMDSQEFTPPPEIGVFHCDGNHGEQAIKDVFRYCPNVVSGGFVVLDDLKWENREQSAQKAIMELPFKELYIVDDPENKNQWGVYQRL